MLEITVKTLDSQNHSFNCEEDITVRGFKEHIAETVSVVAESQRLIYCGRVLQDDKKLNDYDVNGKVIHLVQRAPPQPESRNNTGGDGQRQNNNNGWPQNGSLLQYRGQLRRNAMYLGAMSVPAEVVEGHGLPPPQLSNTLSNSRLVTAGRMLNKAIQLMDRLDDPTIPLHPSPTENNASEPAPQASAPEEEAESDSNVNSNLTNGRNRMVQAASEIAAAFSAAALINIRLSHDNSEDEGSVTGTVNVVDTSGSRPNVSPPTTQESERPQATTSEAAQSSEPERPEAGKSETENSESTRTQAQRAEPERPDASANNNDQNSSRRSTPHVPRPPQMAELLERLVNTQDRLRPYIERYRSLMSADPILQPGNGPEGVTENQRIVDGVSESLHYLSHACHALSDIIVDMGQQPPRNLRCRPIIIQHSAILQAGIPIQVESHINLTNRNATNNNNTTDDANEATRPSSPTSSTSDQNSRSSNANNRAPSQNANGPLNQSPSLLGTLLNLPSNVEVSMELSPQSAMDLSSPSGVDGSENDMGGASGNLYSMAPPFALIRDALQSVLSERHSQMETSSGATINNLSNIPFVTIVGQQMDIGTPNSGQSTQARSNIGTHPTTSTQTRSTARPHVLHPHTHPLNVGMGMGQNLDFDAFLPCNSHHVRRNPPASANSTSTSQSNQANQSATSENRTQSNSATRSSTSARNPPQSQTVNFTVGGDPNLLARDLETDGQALASGIGLAMSIGELLNAPASGGVHISFVGGGPSNANEIHLTPNSDVSLADLLRRFNVRLEEFTGRNFLIDLWLLLLRNVTFGGLMQLSLGQSSPLASLRRPVREFLDQTFPDAGQADVLQSLVVDLIIFHSRSFIRNLVPEEESANSRINIPLTIEALLIQFCSEFLKLLFNNDLDDTTFAQEAITLAKEIEDVSSAVILHILRGGQISLENIISRSITQLTEGVHPFFQQTMLDLLNTRIRAYATRSPQMSATEIESFLVYKDEPSAPPDEEGAAAAATASSEPKVKSESKPAEQSKPQVQSQPSQQQQQKPQESVVKQESQEQPMEVKHESVDIEMPEVKVVDDPMDIANGEEIPETFPGAESLPADWVPIIARDSVRQRKQAQLQALQGGPLPFSDAYLSTMPSKRRKLIEQQKPQLLAQPTSNATAIAASVERLVREGIAHSHVNEAEGAACAVASAPAVRTAFGQAIKECIPKARLRTPDFPNSTRFPNATKYFADGGSDDNNKDGTAKQQQQQQPSAAMNEQSK